MNIGFKNYLGQTFIIKTVFYDSTYLVIQKNTPFQVWKKVPIRLALPF